jgi:hypothetical protein
MMIALRDPIRAAISRLSWETWGFNEARVKVEFEGQDGVRIAVIMDRAKLVDLLSDAALFLDDFGVQELNRRIIARWTKGLPPRGEATLIPTTDLRYVSWVAESR